MKKKDFVKLLAEAMEVSQKEANETFTLVFDVITDVMDGGEEVSVPKFGKFFTQVRNARTCRNPKTGEPMEVPEKRVPKFKASSVLKASMLEE
jgi:nucleoid DNA-binding protein